MRSSKSLLVPAGSPNAPELLKQEQSASAEFSKESFRRNLNRKGSALSASGRN